MFTTTFAQVRNFRRVDGKPEVQTIVKRGTERKSEKEERAEGIRAGVFQSPIQRVSKNRGSFGEDTH